jgi:uncharacterized protein YndB with AHSA1/START domain
MNKSNLVVMREEKAFEMSRLFDATPERVWRICTDPLMIPKWWGLRSQTTIVDKMDVRVGGGWRYIQKDANGNEYAFRGEYKVVEPPHKLVATFEFEPMAGHIVTDHYRFEAQPGGKTKVIVKSVFDTLEALEGMLQSGMEEGANESWDRLEELLAA